MCSAPSECQFLEGLTCSQCSAVHVVTFGCVNQPHALLCTETSQINPTVCPTVTLRNAFSSSTLHLSQLYHIVILEIFIHEKFLNSSASISYARIFRKQRKSMVAQQSTIFLCMHMQVCAISTVLLWCCEFISHQIKVVVKSSEQCLQPL